MTARTSTAAPILAALAIVLLPLASYVGGYFWLGTRRVWVSAAVSSSGAEVLDAIERTYPHQWLVTIYHPAGWIEEKCLGIDVLILHADSIKGGGP